MVGAEAGRSLLWVARRPRRRAGPGSVRDDARAGPELCERLWYGPARDQRVHGLWPPPHERARRRFSFTRRGGSFGGRSPAHTERAVFGRTGLLCLRTASRASVSKEASCARGELLHAADEVDRARGRARAWRSAAPRARRPPSTARRRDRGREIHAQAGRPILRNASAFSSAMPARPMCPRRTAVDERQPRGGRASARVGIRMRRSGQSLRKPTRTKRPPGSDGWPVKLVIVQHLGSQRRTSARRRAEQQRPPRRLARRRWLDNVTADGDRNRDWRKMVGSVGDCI